MPRFSTVKRTIVALAVSFCIAFLLWYGMFTGKSIPEKVVCESDLLSLTPLIELFRQVQGRYPTTDEGLSVLVTPPSDPVAASKWYGYASSLPTDPWKHSYQYVYPGRRHPDSFDLFSLGPDGVKSEDDIYVPEHDP